MPAATPAPDGPKMPSLISHEEFRKTDGYRELCAEYDINPDTSWDDEPVVSITAAWEFLERYEKMRRDCSGYTPEHVAAYLEGLVLRHEGDPGAIVLIDRYGATLVVQDPLGECWELPVGKANPARVAQALAEHKISATPPN